MSNICKPEPQASGPDNSDEDDGLTERERKLRHIRAQFEDLKQQLVGETKSETLSERRKRNEEDKSKTKSSELTTSSPVQAPDPDETGDIKLKISTKRSRDRERETLELLKRFRKRLKEAPKCADTTANGKPTTIDNGGSHRENSKHHEPVITSIDLAPELDDLDKVDGDAWLLHTFVADDEVRLARDANVDWYSVDDPRSESQDRTRAGGGFNRPQARDRDDTSRHNNRSERSDRIHSRRHQHHHRSHRDDQRDHQRDDRNRDQYNDRKRDRDGDTERESGRSK